MYVLRIIAINLIIIFFTSGIPSQPLLASESVIIYGRGNAHGVGASMAGVYGMARDGQNYQQIINYYYPGTTWNTRDDNTIIEAKCAVHGTWVTLTVREYLYRLAEEPDTWPTEGLRSLMVAARTYLWSKLEAYGNMSGGQHFIHSVVTDRAVRGNIMQAVDDTSNQVLTYNNMAIKAAYSGSAGGYTAKMSEIWGSDDRLYPYLINQESSHDSVFPSTYQWSTELTAAQIQDAYPQIGSFESLSIEERTSSSLTKSRVKAIKITGSASSVNDTGWNFKNKLGIKSNFFWLEPWPQEAQPIESDPEVPAPTPTPPTIPTSPSPTTPTPQPETPEPKLSQPKAILRTTARRATVKKSKFTKLYFRIYHSKVINVKVKLVFKRGSKTVGSRWVGVKKTNRLNTARIVFNKMKPGKYTYYVYAYASKSKTNHPGKNQLIILN